MPNVVQQQDAPSRLDIRIQEMDGKSYMVTEGDHVLCFSSNLDFRTWFEEQENEEPATLWQRIWNG